MPAARGAGIGVVPWSLLSGGFLAGKYSRDGAGASGEGRLAGDNPLGRTPFTDRNWRVLDGLERVAAEAGRRLAEVVLAWTAARPGVDSVLIGTSRVE